MRCGVLFLSAALMWAGGLASAALAASHGRRPEPAAARPVANEKAFPFDVTWVLQTINNKPTGTGDPPSFSIDPSLRARGFAGCNTFSMSYYPVRNQTLSSGAIAMTRNTCSAAAKAMELTVLVAMHSQPKWDLRSDGDLVLTAGRTVLRFRRGV